MLNFNRKYLYLITLLATSAIVNAQESTARFIPGKGIDSIELKSIECRNATNTSWENPKNDPINEAGNSILTIGTLTTLNPDFASTFNSSGNATIATGSYYHKSPQALYSLTKMQIKLNNNTMIDAIFYLGQGCNFYGRKNWWLASTKGELYKTPGFCTSPRRDGITVQDGNNQQYCIYAYQGDLSVNAFIINKGACTTDKNKKAINAWSQTSKVVVGAVGAVTIFSTAIGATAAALASQNANNQPALFNGTNSNGTEFGDYFNSTLPANATMDWQESGFNSTDLYEWDNTTNANESSALNSSTTSDYVSTTTAPMVSPEISISGKELVLVGRQVTFEANFIKGNVANAAYYWELPDRWSIIGRSDREYITVQIPTNEIAAQGNITVTINDKKNGCKYNKVKTVNIVQKPVINARTERVEKPWRGCGRIIGHSKCLDGEMSMYTEGWKIIEAKVTFRSDGGVIDNIVLGGFTVGKIDVTVAGSRTLSRSEYIIQDDRLSHYTSTRGDLFTYYYSLFVYDFSLKLQNKKHPKIIVNESFRYSDYK